MNFLGKIFGFKKKSPVELEIIAENEREYFLKGNSLIQPYIHIAGRQSIIVKQKDLPVIFEGFKYLDAVITINPNNFAAYWIKGKGYQAIRQHDLAYLAFKKSFKLNRGNPDVTRELMIECTTLGKGTEAVELALFALSLDKLNPGLLGNLALAYLINGDIDLAKSTITDAISRAPEDTINRSLNEVIDEVISGNRKRPTKSGDLF